MVLEGHQIVVLRLCLVALMLLCQPTVVGARTSLDWHAFKAHHLIGGRVVDQAHAGASHSEGQAYAMLLAVIFEDRKAFDQIWDWAREHLQVREDALLSWNWNPERGIVDPNNATDADLIAAWALARAAVTWRHAPYQQASNQITASISDKLLHQHSEMLVLLPGEQGFLSKEGVALNLSYWVYPALNALAEFQPELNRVRDSGLRLLEHAKFGRWNLPSDWVFLATNSSELEITPWTQQVPRYGYDAIRIPLYLKWAGYDNNARNQPYTAFVKSFCQFELIPDWVDLNHNTVHMNPASRGMLSIYRLITPTTLEGCSFSPPALAPSYYSDALHLLAVSAQVESERR